MNLTGNEPMEAVVIPGFIYGDGSSEPPSVKGGLTIRQHFAAIAMQGMLSYSYRPDADGWKTIARDAVAAADELIKELNKPV